MTPSAANIFRTVAAAAIALSVMAAVAKAQTNKPRVPAGRDPGGVAIAILTPGITYTDPAIAACLARDGEGDIIGLDTIDGDRLPWRTPGTTVATNHGRDVDVLLRQLPCARGIRVIPIRVDPTVPLSLGKAIAFAAQTPARIVVVPMWSATLADWLAFGSATAAFKNVLIIAAAGDDNRNLDGSPVYPASFTLAGRDTPSLPNLIAVAGGIGDHATFQHTTNFGAKTITLTLVDGATDRPAPTTLASPSARAALDVAWSLACSVPKSMTNPDAAALKQILMTSARKTPTADGHTLFDPGCHKR